MDLLGSILNSMEKPPQTTSTQEIMAKKAQENLKKMHEAEKNNIKKFRQKIEHQLMHFINNDEEQKLKFPTMEKLHRTIIHDIADKHDLITYSFGIEGIDRHSIVYKKEFKPSDEELECLRNGDAYDRKLKELQEKMSENCGSSGKKSTADGVNKDKNFVPNSNYKLKYASIIGLDAGEAAAKITTPNQQFGMVPSSNKRDLRSIEQILNDNKIKKMKNQ